MRTPFAYFGNKAKIAPLIWQRLGDPRYYVEPFGGALATILNRPSSHSLNHKREVVGDLDCFVVHFFRALKHDPAGVAHYAFDPVSTVELKARHDWLIDQEPIVIGRMADPDWYDAKIAGWWLWGQQLFVGRHWCNPTLNLTGTLPYSRSWEGYRADTPTELLARFTEISVRLRNIVLIQGDWRATIEKGLLGIKPNTIKGVLLDPPYTKRTGRMEKLYRIDSFTVGDEAAAWAVSKSNDSTYRIALCGLEDEYDLPGWYELAWNTGAGRSNSARERIWFSPSCLPPEMQVAS